MSYDDALARRCPLPDCRDRWLPPDVDLWDHLTRWPHLVDDDEANRICEGLRRDREHGRLRRGREFMWNWTLGTYPASDVAGRRALNAAHDLLAGAIHSLYVHGPTGGGKTGLAYGTCAAWLAIENSDERDWYPQVDFINLRTLLADQKARFGRGESQDMGRLLDAHSGWDRLVVLDDLGAERPTEWAVEVIALIVEHLHAVNARVLVTTNYAPSELAARLGRHDPISGQRLISRLVENARLVHLERPDLRAKNDSEGGR
jgi:DNA replication protein DnaC